MALFYLATGIGTSIIILKLIRSILWRTVSETHYISMEAIITRTEWIIYPIRKLLKKTCLS